MNINKDLGQGDGGIHEEPLPEDESGDELEPNSKFPPEGEEGRATMPSWLDLIDEGSADEFDDFENEEYVLSVGRDEANKNFMADEAVMTSSDKESNLLKFDDENETDTLPLNEADESALLTSDSDNETEVEPPSKYARLFDMQSVHEDDESKTGDTELKSVNHLKNVDVDVDNLSDSENAEDCANSNTLEDLLRMGENELNNEKDVKMDQGDDASKIENRSESDSEDDLRIVYEGSQSEQDDESDDDLRVVYEGSQSESEQEADDEPRIVYEGSQSEDESTTNFNDNRKVEGDSEEDEPENEIEVQQHTTETDEEAEMDEEFEIEGRGANTERLYCGKTLDMLDEEDNTEQDPFNDSNCVSEAGSDENLDEAEFNRRWAEFTKMNDHWNRIIDEQEHKQDQEDIPIHRKRRSIHRPIPRFIQPTSSVNASNLGVRKIIRKKKRLYGVRRRRFTRPKRPLPNPPRSHPEPDYMDVDDIDLSLVKTEVVDEDESYGNYAETQIYIDNDDEEASEPPPALSRSPSPPPPAPPRSPSPPPPPQSKPKPKEHLYPHLNRRQLLQCFAALGQVIVLPDAPKLSTFVNQEGLVENKYTPEGVHIPAPDTPYWRERRRRKAAALAAAKEANIPVHDTQSSSAKPKSTEESPLFVNASDPSHVRKRWYKDVLHASTREQELNEDDNDSYDYKCVEPGDDDWESDSNSTPAHSSSPAPGDGDFTQNDDQPGHENADADTLPLSPPRQAADSAIRIKDDGAGNVFIDMDPAVPGFHDIESGNFYPKPPIPYSCLVVMALKNCLTGTLPVSEIYLFLCDHFPFFRTAPSGWKNSVRHNLSLNKGFTKITTHVDALLDKKRASLWALDGIKKERMESELYKWIERTGRSSLEESMSDPENLDALLAGEFKRDYSGKIAAEEEEDDDVQPCAEPQAQVNPETGLPMSFSGSVSQMRAFLQQQHSASNTITLLSVEPESATGKPVVEPIGLKPGTTLGSVLTTQAQYLHQIGPSTYRISPFPDPINNFSAGGESTPLILRRSLPKPGILK